MYVLLNLDVLSNFQFILSFQGCKFYPIYSSSFLTKKLVQLESKIFPIFARDLKNNQ